MEARVTLARGLHFDVVLKDSGYRLEIDTAPEHGGTAPGARPMELVLGGLAGCTAFDVVSILRKARQEVTGFDVIANGERATEDPKVYTHITVEYVVRGHNISEEVLRRAILLSEEKYCSVAAMLSKTARIETRYRIIEE
ncbi:MAG: OsmC family protein [Sphingomonadaceae bacterium]